MKLIVAAAALALAGCASSPASEGWTATANAQRIPWENNETAWLLTCGRADAASCYGRAKDVCPNGFERRSENVASISSMTLTVTCRP